MRILAENVGIFFRRVGEKSRIDLVYFLRNGLWVGMRQGVGTLTGLLLTVSFARLSSQEIFGQFQLILSLLAVVSLFSLPGLNTSLTRSVASGFDGDYEQVVRKSFLWSLLGIPVLFIFGIYYYSFQDESLGLAILLASVFLPFFYAPNTWDSFLQGKGRFDVATKYSSIQSILNATTTVGIVFFYRESLFAITVAYLSSYSLLNLYFYFKSRRYTENSTSGPETFSYGIFLTRVNVLEVVSSNLDKVFIGLFLSPAQLAVYSIGTLFAKYIQNISKSFLWIAIPKQVSHGFVSRRNYWMIFFLSLFVTGFFLGALQYLIPALFSEKYSQSIHLSELAILFYPFFILNTLYKNQVIFDQTKGAVVADSVISPIIRIGLTCVLLPMYGVAGLAFLFGFQYLVSLGVLIVTRFFSSRIR